MILAELIDCQQHAGRTTSIHPCRVLGLGCFFQSLSHKTHLSKAAILCGNADLASKVFELLDHEEVCFGLGAQANLDFVAKLASLLGKIIERCCAIPPANQDVTLTNQLEALAKWSAYPYWCAFNKLAEGMAEEANIANG